MSTQTEPVPRRSSTRDGGLRQRLHEVIFEAETPAGKLFDVLLLVAIVLSIVAVCLESVSSIRAHHGLALRVTEWILTVFFTIEYVLRLWTTEKTSRYATSFFGVVDLLAILPTYIGLFLPGAQALLVIRALRLLRIFRIFKITRYVQEVNSLVRAFSATRAKILVFLFVVSTAVLIMGSAMYVVEGPEAGFTSIPRATYWAIVTMTTVGYGDIAPSTGFGQAIAAVAMVLGYSMIIIPTGVFAVEFVAAKKEVTGVACPVCSREGHDSDARHCKYCGGLL